MILSNLSSKSDICLFCAMIYNNPVSHFSPKPDSLSLGPVLYAWAKTLQGKFGRHHHLGGCYRSWIAISLNKR